MQIFTATTLAAMAVLQPWSPISTITRSESLLVRHVVDGDTIDVATIGRVRLLGIDAPALGRGHASAAPFAREARDRLTTLVLNRWVRLEFEGGAYGRPARHAAYVMTEDGVFVNAALVRDGLARVTARVPLTRLSELQRAEAEAQSFRRGMWGATPQPPGPGYTRPSGAAFKEPALRAKKKKSSAK